MSTAVWHELGPADGSCTVCGAVDTLTVGEARFHRNLLERVRREYCAPPARFVTCSDCGWRWSVRAADRTANGVRRRAGTARQDTRVDDPVPAPTRVDDLTPPTSRVDDMPLSATRTVLPEPRGGRALSRDWSYPRF